MGGIHFLHNNRTEKMVVRMRIMEQLHTRTRYAPLLMAVDACWGKVT